MGVSDVLVSTYVVWVLSHFSRVQLFVTLSMDDSPPGSSVHRIIPTKILEWVAMPPSRGSSWPRGWTCFSYVYLHWAGEFFTTSATWEAGTCVGHVLNVLTNTCSREGRVHRSWRTSETWATSKWPYWSPRPVRLWQSPYVNPHSQLF